MESLSKIMLKHKKKLKGFTMIPNWFLEDNNFSVYEKMTIIIILKHRRNKQQAWPSQKIIASQIGCSVSTVKKAIGKLQRTGIIKITRLKNCSNNVYAINFPQN